MTTAPRRRPPDIYLPKTDEHIPADFRRADQHATCRVCGEEYRDHQNYIYGECGDNWNLRLVRTCDGKFWKL